MELRHLRYFVAVATELNFSRAAEAELISQPALSIQIADLEREVGTRLLHRSKRMVQLTAAGKVFLEEAQSILEAADRAKAKALRASRGEVGELRIGYFSAPMMSILPELIRSYQAAFPSVTIRMKELTPDCQLEEFANQKIDVGFTRPLPAGYPELISEVLFQERFLAVVSDQHPLAARKRIRLYELANEPLILLEREVARGLYDLVIAACRTAGFSPNIHHQVDQMSSVLTLVAAGQGVSVVPEGVRHLRQQQVKFLPLWPDIGSIPLVICWDKTRDCPPCFEFLAMVQERLPTILASAKMLP